jgi:hypothetical protein
MRTVVVLIAVLFCCGCIVGQNPAGTTAVPVETMQPPLPLPSPGAPDGQSNFIFRAQKSGDNVTMTYFAVSDMSKPMTGAPYTATAVTETTQVLADGNRIVNKTESQLARDSQGRTRRQETMNNLGPLATNAPNMALINDPVGKVSYVLDLNDKTARVIKIPAPEQEGGGPTPMALAPVVKDGARAPGQAAVQKRVLIAGGAAGVGVEQRVWVSSAEDGQVKTESLGKQTIEGVAATGTRTTRTIPAGEIGNERPLEITSEVWTSPDLQMLVLSKRTDPRIGETVYRLTNIQRGDPDPSLFQVPSGFTMK